MFGVKIPVKYLFRTYFFSNEMEKKPRFCSISDICTV